jgi:hypothetical protein
MSDIHAEEDHERIFKKYIYIIKQKDKDKIKSCAGSHHGHLFLTLSKV